MKTQITLCIIIVEVIHVYILPLRNENLILVSLNKGEGWFVYILPLRNENIWTISFLKCSDKVYILPLRNENWGRVIISGLFVICLYPTFKEWKR